MVQIKVTPSHAGVRTFDIGCPAPHLVPLRQFYKKSGAGVRYINS